MKQSLRNTSALTSFIWRKAPGCASLIAMLAASPVAHAQDVTPVPDISVVAPVPSPSGAEGQRPSGGSSSSAPAGAVPVPVAPAEGSEAAGYKPNTVSNFGPLGPTPILDVPYSVNVISSDLIENKIGGTTETVFQISPVAQLSQPSSRLQNPAFYLRGFLFQGSSGNIAIDGLRGLMGVPIPIEDKERAEIYTGLMGFLYGPAVVGGMVNYVYKRPTETPFASVTVGDYGNLAGFTHGDFGGPIDKDGMFAYRLNVVVQHGDLPVSPQSEDRQLATLALDWHILPGTTLELLGSHQFSDQHVAGTYWLVSTNPNGSSKFNYSWVPNPSKIFGEPWTSTPIETDRAEVNLTSKLNDIFTARLAYAFASSYEFATKIEDNQLTNSSGSYGQYTWQNTGNGFYTHSACGLLDAHFNTWSFEHKMTMGYYGYYQENQSGAGSATPQYLINSSAFNIFFGPTNIPQPNFTNPVSYYGARYTSATTLFHNYIVGDEIKFNQYLSALVGANYAEIIANNYNNTPPFALSSAYDKGKLTPSLSLIFKPVSWVSTYATYSQSLEQGLFVPATGAVIYTNAGQTLPPFVDKQYEIGAKANVGGMLLTAALFDINKALQYAVVNPNGTSTYLQDGREVHKGVELTATGNVMDGFRVLGGVTLLDPQVTNQQANTALIGKEPAGVASRLAKITAEYDLPFAPGLTLTGGVYYTGSQAADTVNSVYLPGFVTEDLGLRYRTHLPTGQEAIFRLQVSNLTNNAFWIQPNETGMPRTIAFSTQIKF